MTNRPPLWRVKQLGETGSTNDDAKTAAEAGEPEGLVVWALRQTSGHGRQGRTWESPPGNLYTSLLLRPDVEMRRAGHYAFVAALAMFDTVHPLLPHADVTLKWPNDVLVDKKKIGGILLESSARKDGKLEWLVAGMGLNVAYHPADTPFPATSLQATDAKESPLAELVDRLFGHFYRWKEILEQDGFGPLREAWLAHAQKGPMTVKASKHTINGDFAGLNEDGGLILLLADGTKQAIAAGDIGISG